MLGWLKSVGWFGLCGDLGEVVVRFVKNKNDASRTLLIE